MSQHPIAVSATDVAPRIKPSNYPEPFATMVKGRIKRQLGDVFGLSNFGVNLTELPVGTRSALRHSHSKQDEFVYILQGQATLITGAGEQLLNAGDCAGFKANSDDAHHLINQSNATVIYLEVGDRSPNDEVSYPDDDVVAKLHNGTWLFTHKDNTPY